MYVDHNILRGFDESGIKSDVEILNGATVKTNLHTSKIYEAATIDLSTT